jgi:hypothetical protein
MDLPTINVFISLAPSSEVFELIKSDHADLASPCPILQQNGHVRGPNGPREGLAHHPNSNLVCRTAPMRMICSRLWHCRAAHPEILEPVRDAGEAAAEVARGCELCFDRLPRAVGSSQSAGSIG